MNVTLKNTIPSKQPHLPTSIFAVMSAMAQSAGALNLSQGFPDFNCPEELIALQQEFMKAGHNQYAPMPGIRPLREVIVQKYQKLYKADYDPVSEITITAGATEALYAAITAIVQPGDEVIVFEPWYDAYLPMIEYSGGKPVTISMEPPDYNVPWEKVKQAINSRTRAIVLNSPHNPSGAMLDMQDIKALENIVFGTDIVLIGDEVYEHIVFDGKPHLSFAASRELAGRSYVIGSFGKTFHATGWKVGYVLAPRVLMDELRKIHQFITFSVHTPTQFAYAAYMRDEAHYMQLGAFYQRKRDLFRDGLKASRFTLLPCSGTYFQMVGYERISDEDDRDFAERLVREFKIASIPTSAFYVSGKGPGILRFCFAKKDETLKKAVDILCRI